MITLVIIDKFMPKDALERIQEGLNDREKEYLLVRHLEKSEQLTDLESMPDIIVYRFNPLDRDWGTSTACIATDLAGLKRRFKDKAPCVLGIGKDERKRMILNRHGADFFVREHLATEALKWFVTGLIRGHTANKVL